jgi:spore maturation protein CgeB
MEKIRWLLERPAQREAIGRAAETRALAQHTYARRAERLADIIRKSLRRKASGSARRLQCLNDEAGRPGNSPPD